jgi:[ribosomal protein S18]-alanine N-acetyltransferase
MMSIVSRLLPNAPPQFTTASSRDAVAIAALHAASFRRGWGEDEVYRLLVDSAVVAHRATIRGGLVGFIMSRVAADEAEILSIAIAPARRGHGLSKPLLDIHLRTLAGRAVRAVFLEVDERNTPARRLYNRAGFREVGRRQGYYESGAAALVLRRDLG